VTGYISSGMNLGFDFTGGNVVTVLLANNEANENFAQHSQTIREVVEYHEGRFAIALITSWVGADGIAVRYTFADTSVENQETRNAAIQAQLLEVFEGYLDSNVIYLDHMGAAASQALIASAFLSLFIAIILILIYCAIRFKLWSGVAAVIAQLHDALLMFSLVIIFRVQMNTGFVAALITVASYSITNTVVVFDRVRENTKVAEMQGEKYDVKEVVNRSIFQTLRISFNTTITTLFGILLLAIIGVATIREFAIPVIFGLVVGIYSSLILAPSIYVGLIETADKFKAKRKINKPNEQNMAKEGRKPAK
jgi:preprotein translocase subunit SecF